MRHGAIVNSAGRFVGQRDLPLSDEGYRQALSWREYFSIIQLDICITSDLLRCQQTAKAVLGKQAIPIVIEPRLREISLGQWEGLLPEEVQINFHDDYARRGCDLASTRPAGGESFEDLYKRVIPAIQHIARQYAEKHVLLVAHSGVNRTILSFLMALPLSGLMDIPQPYACCCCFEQSQLDL